MSEEQETLEGHLRSWILRARPKVEDLLAVRTLEEKEYLRGGFEALVAFEKVIDSFVRGPQEEPSRFNGAVDMSNIQWGE